MRSHKVDGNSIVCVLDFGESSCGPYTGKGSESK